MFYFEIMESFYHNRINYMITGGLAVNLHGVPRTTQDIDIIILMEKDNIIKLCNTLKELDYIPRLPVNPEDMADNHILNGWIKEKNMMAFSFYHKKQNYRVIDIVLVHPLDYKKAEARREIINIRGIEIPVISIDDLIKMKKVSGRSRDISDIKMLKQAKKIMEKENG